MATKSNSNVRKSKKSKQKLTKNQKYAAVISLVVFAGLGAFLTFRSFAAGEAFFATAEPISECNTRSAVTKEDANGSGKRNKFVCYMGDTSRWTPADVFEYLTGNPYDNASGVMKQTTASLQQRLRLKGNSKMKICLTARGDQSTYVYISGGVKGLKDEKVNISKSNDYSVNYCANPRTLANWGQEMEPVSITADFGGVWIKNISVQGVQ